MSINANNNTLIFMEAKSSTIHIVAIGKTLTNLFALKNGWNHSHISMKIVNNGLFGVCGSNSLVVLFKADTTNQNGKTPNILKFVQFHSMNLKNDVSDFDIVEYNVSWLIFVAVPLH